jgi:two-component system, chemotaxis family, CheB/CheR fusion protein
MTKQGPRQAGTASRQPGRRSSPRCGSPLGHDSFPVVGLGASAGGLDAFRRLLAVLPAGPGMAFILIQHLDPTHASMMVDLLAGHTPLKVQQAADGMPLEREHIYLIPPGAYLSIRGGALRLSEPSERHGARLPFDFFLRSLAEELGERAICVILSGTGGDGSLGLKAVKEKGGLVIAQDPDEAEYDGMPRSAIMTGAVDLVLPVAKIPETLAKYGRQLVLNGERRKGLAPDDHRPDRLAEIIDLLRTKTAHDFALYKPGTLLRRIERRMALAAVPDIARYLDMVRQDSGEIDLLAKDLLINVTSFFRDPKAFELLAKQVIPDLVRRQPSDRPLRIWVAGCSTGEETCSLAMLFFEEMATAKRNLRLQVFASDVDENAVALAREGRYPETIAADVSPERLARFFTQEEHGYRVVPELRGVVVFTAQDVLADPPFSRLDLISCRNLLIYLRPEAQEKVLLLFHFALREGGVLMLGNSETVGSLDDRFEAISKTQRIYRQIGHSRPGEVDFPIGPGGGARTLWPGRTPPAATQGISARDLTQRLLLETYAPASVLINRKHECLYFSGPTDRFLRVAAGEPSRDLLAMVREGLRNKLRAAIQQASREHALAIATGAQASHGGSAVPVRIEVHPVQNEDLLLVSFFDQPAHEPRPAQAVEPPDDLSRIAELERELDATRKELQSTIHDLEIANEEQKAINQEAMSANEEFQSTNEELMTSREELQSLNEELTALNSQLQETLERQRSTSNDLHNILDSSGVATLFLDSELNIRFFTPATKSLFRVIATDIGRPLADLARRINDPRLLADAGTVLAGDVPPNREVEGDNGAWYTRRILPYRTQDAQVEGVVITFADISERKTAERAIEASRSYSDSIINTIRQPLVVLDEELCVISASRSFYSTFSVVPEQTVGRQLDAVDNGRLDIAALRGFLDRLRNGEGVIEDHEIDVELPSRGLRSLLVSALEIREEPLATRKILLTIDDITERKHAAEALEAAKRQAEHANLGKSRFLAAASHDLRQPLQTISLLHEMLAKKVKDETTLALVGRLDETVSTMSSMLDTLLDINQLEAGIVRREMVDFPINAVLEHLRTQFSFHAAAHRLGWRVVPSSLSVRSDPRLLEQMIRNLLSNAVKYTDKGTILLGCRRRGDKLRIEVWDTGIGVPEEQLQAIFEEFHQLDNPVRERSKGLGLGLAIVERLADLLGHTVDVRSRPGKGSVFAVEVPLGRDAPPWRPWLDRREVQESAPQSGAILVVEDDPPVREMLALLLEGEGHRTTTAEDGRKALELAERGAIRPDLVVADYNLPKGLNGLQVVAGLQETLGHEIPAVILTGDISTDTLREIARGGRLHLNKPVKAKELMELIRRCLADLRPPVAASARQPAEMAGDGPRPPTIFVVDDDGAVREAMRDLLRANGRTVETYTSSEAFLDAYRPGSEGCLLVDARMPGMGGLALLQRLKGEGSRLVSIMITGQGDVPMAVEAMRAGAADFIEKPIRRNELFASIEHALEHIRDSGKLSVRQEAAVKRLAGLTARQRQIMELVLAGHPSKNIAADLGISQRTVENHRAAVMKKTGSHSLSALIRLALAADSGTGSESPH